MDIVSASIGFFTSAFKVYRTIAAAIDIGSNGAKWNVLMRIERVRFEIWGLELGFLDKETGKPKNEGIIESKAVAELDDILQDQTIGILVRDTLESIVDVLKNFNKSVKKYRVDHDADHRSKKLLDKTKDFSAHLLMAINDEKEVEGLLKNLKTLNDGLENVLSLPQKIRVQKGLPSGVLPKYRSAAELDDFIEISRSTVTGDMNTGMTYSEQYPALLATAKVKYRCVEMAIPTSEHKTTAFRQPSDSEIPLEKIRITKTPRRTANLRWPSGIAILDYDNNQKFHVLVEWRESNSVSLEVSEDELNLRRKMLVQLLHETSNEPNAADYRVLDCLGYCRSNGKVEEGTLRVPIVGFVSKIPDWADGRRQPKTLHKLLENSFEDKNFDTTPSLGARFQLARQLATALYQLQCSQWLHRHLSSHQVVFFYDKTTGKLRFEEPFLIGLQYSRPDDQGVVRKHPSEGLGRTNWSSLDLYLHPDFSIKKRRRYRRSDDVYSIGVILLEIAFWKPVSAFHEDAKGVYSMESVLNTARRLVEATRVELSAVVGEIYRDAVVHCLEGIRQDIPKQKEGVGREEDIERGKNVEKKGMSKENMMSRKRTILKVEKMLEKMLEKISEKTMPKERKISQKKEYVKRQKDVEREENIEEKEEVEGDDGVIVEEPYRGKYRGEDPEIGLEADFYRMVLNEIAKCRA
ncbi:prion-inhibition and propagation-domain-containing protein [Xylaria curta]|nr:prion-inhibition and propagation-domain-containing protein [Xylaria curta]